MLANLIKIYVSNDKKYRGKEYDILDVKLQVFYNCYTKVGLAESQFYLAYLIILKGKASTFYYNKISGRLYDFTRIIEMTKTYFKTKEQ